MYVMIRLIPAGTKQQYVWHRTGQPVVGTMLCADDSMQFNAVLYALATVCCAHSQAESG